MDKEFTTIAEFISFATDVAKKDKGIKNMDRLVNNKPNDQIKLAVKQVFSTFFGGILEYKNFTGSIVYKTGYVNMATLEKVCSKNDDDFKTFQDYMDTFRALYSDVRRNLAEFMKKLNLEESSPEATFVSNLFSEVGGEIIETIKSGGGTKDIASLLPKVMEMVKSGKLMSAFEKLKTGNVKISKILKAFTILVEEYENEGQTIMPPQENEVSTSVVEADDD